MRVNGRSRRILIGATLAVALAAVMGALVGYFTWSGRTASASMVPPIRLFRPYRYSGPYGAGGYARGSGGYGEYGGAYESGGGSSSSASSVSASITSKVDPALVDINTDLGLEGGRAAGTGMVLTATGEVITNNHVITGATTIKATDIGNGTTYAAHVVGFDYGHDIAVLQLEGATGLKAVSLGDSGSLKVGENIATIGNAGGAGGTPTAAAGQISALEQSITAGDELDGGQERLTGLIQLQGELQPGDSGGPLVNDNGEVVGMDTAASATFQFESSADEGFAIPIDEVEEIAKQIREGEGSRTIHIGATGLLGVLLQSASGEGALVENVISDTPAASSGLSAGDTITAFDGISLSAPNALTEMMLQKHPGNTVTIAWQTPTGVQQTATLTLASGPPQ